MSSFDNPTALINDDAAKFLLNEGCGVPAAEAQAVYVRHKPNQSTVVALQFSTSHGDIGRAYAHWTAESWRADQVHAKALSLRPRSTPLRAPSPPTVARTQRRPTLLRAQTSTMVRATL